MAVVHVLPTFQAGRRPLRMLEVGFLETGNASANLPLAITQIDDVLLETPRPVSNLLTPRKILDMGERICWVVSTVPCDINHYGYFP